MANSYTRIILHCVWSTKRRRMLINREWECSLWAYIGGIARKRGIHPIQIGGIENHIHALVEPPKSMPVPEVLAWLKTPSSHWINRSNMVVGKFHWQDGYGAFSVSPSQLPRVIQYIKNQRKHHYRNSFETEYRELLKGHAVTHDEEYLFD